MEGIARFGWVVVAAVLAVGLAAGTVDLIWNHTLVALGIAAVLGVLLAVTWLLMLYGDRGTEREAARPMTPEEDEERARRVQKEPNGRPYIS